MSGGIRQIGIVVSGPYVSGLQAVLTGLVRAADRLEMEVWALRDGFDGLLSPERYPEGGLTQLSPRLLEGLANIPVGIIGLGRRTDPFRMRSLTADGMIEETDRSAELLELIRSKRLDAVIAVGGPEQLAIFWKLSCLGLPLVCIPVAIENDIPATFLSFGYNSALTYVVETLHRARLAAQSLGRIAVVEVPGTQAGWLALQAGIAASANATLIPEIPYDLLKVAAGLSEQERSGWTIALVVVAEGAAPAAGAPALEPTGSHIIETSGLAAETVALELQRLTSHETFTIVPGTLVRGGPNTAVDWQLGMGFGAAAVRALQTGQPGVMVGFRPPDLVFTPLAEVVNRVRTVTADTEFLQVARAMGICLGD
jgi:6-phosphofructokinase